MINKAAIVGTGNIAWHLSDVLLKIGVEISCISSRKIQHAEELAALRKSKATDLKSMDLSVDLIIISVSDDAIFEVSQQISEGNYIVIHTSGSVSIDVFKDRFKHFGVLYPLQSFSKSKKVDIKKVPILVEGNNKQTSNMLESFTNRFSDRVEIMNSEQRGILHLSAVIANNFVNFLAAKSYDFLENNNIDGSLLQPLMQETIERLRSHHPRKMQTGPAKRNDKNIVNKHIRQLESNPKLQSLYRLISQQIIEEYHGGEL